MVRSLLWIISGGGIWLWLIDASYASRMGSRLIIYFSIVGQRMLCGIPFLSGLVFVGLCQARSKRFLLAGGWVVEQGALLYGKWFLFVLCGVFGGSAMIDVLKTPRGLLRSSFIFFFLSLSPGQRAG